MDYVQVGRQKKVAVVSIPTNVLIRLILKSKNGSVRAKILTNEIRKRAKR